MQYVARVSQPCLGVIRGLAFFSAQSVLKCLLYCIVPPAPARPVACRHDVIAQMRLPWAQVVRQSECRVSTHGGHSHRTLQQLSGRSGGTALALQKSHAMDLKTWLWRGQISSGLTCSFAKTVR